MNAFSADQAGNLICKTQTFGKKENVSQYWAQDVRQRLFSVGPEVKLPCAIMRAGSRFSSDDGRWRTVWKDQTIAAGRYFRRDGFDSPWEWTRHERQGQGAGGEAHTAAPLKYLSISTRDDPEVVEYPDSDKYQAMVRGNTSSRVFVGIQRKENSLDYWDAEP